MPLDEEILIRAKAIHDMLVTRGMHAHAEAVKLAVENAEAEAEAEDEFGSERITEQLEAVSSLSNELTTICQRSPVTIEELTDSLQRSLPALRQLNDVEGAPDWFGERASMITRNFARLAEALKGKDPADYVGSRLAAKVHDCIRAVGVAGHSKDDS